GMLEGETRDAGGSLFGDNLDALHHTGNNFVFDAGIKPLGVFAHHDQIDAWIAGRNMRQVADGPEVGKKFETLAQFDVDAREAAADGRSHRALQSDPGALDGFAEFFRNVFVVLLKRFSAGGKAFPFELDAGGFHHANRGLDDFGADTVAGDEGYFVCHKERTMIGSSGHLNPPRICFSMARSPDHPITRFSFALRFSRVLGLEQVLQFGHELLYVFEVEIDGGKPDVRDFIVAAETVHDELADLAGLALALGGLDDEGLRLIDDLLQLADRHRTLLACAHQAVEYLLAVKALAAAVFLHHHVRDFVDALVGGEALLALQAFAAAADGIGFLALARIHDFVILKPAEGAFHGEYFGLAATPNCSRQVSGLRLLPRLLRRAPSLPKACAVTGVRDGRATVQREQRKQR